MKLKKISEIKISVKYALDKYSSTTPYPGPWYRTKEPYTYVRRLPKK